MNDFYLQVYDIVRLIPEGRVTSYGAIAAFLNAKKSSRLVGYAMNLSHKHDPNIPAHRVVNRNGLLTGRHHFETPETMQQALEREGVKIERNQVVDFDEKYWDPAEELMN